MPSALSAWRRSMNEPIVVAAAGGSGRSTYCDLPQKLRRGTPPEGFSCWRAHWAAAYWVHWAQNEIASA